MLRLAKFLVISTVLLVLGLPLALLMAGLQPDALVTASSEPAPEDIARAKALIKEHDPRSQRPGETRSAEMTERDLSLVLDYALGRFLPVSAEVGLHQGQASVLMTARAPDNPLGRFFNLRIDLSQAPHGVDLEGIRVGNLQVPRVVARRIGQLAHQLLQQNATYRTMASGVVGYQLAEDRLTLTYQWPADWLGHVTSRSRALLVDAAGRERLLALTTRIAAASQKVSVAGKVRLADLLKAAFAEAAARTGARGDAAAENRAAIIATMLYVQGIDAAHLLEEPSAKPHRRARAPIATLRGRRDLAQHFTISAGIAAAGGSRLADTVGLSKEMDDSRGGSGFSFTDLAADRAGVRFTEAATGANASRVQRLVAGQADDTVLMPDVRDLPEFMAEDEFVRRYGGVDTPRFRQIADEIERRIAALEIHRGAP